MTSANKFLLMVVILNLFFVPGTLADTVILKNGKELKVEKTWHEGNQLCFNFHGIKAGIPLSKVLHIKRNSDVRNPSVNPKELCSPLRKDGYCDLQWGRNSASVAGLQKKQTISDLDGVVEYIRPADPLNIGDATLKSVIYAFWRDRLYTVTVWTEGYSNYTALRDAVFKEFGPGIRNDFTRERYVWSDELSDIMLDYTKDGQYGMLWLRSKEIDHRCRSSRLKGHASLLKWMKSRN
jgi:hypothetical protein